MLVVLLGTPAVLAVPVRAAGLFVGPLVGVVMVSGNGAGIHVDAVS